MNWQFGMYSISMFIITVLLFAIAGLIWRHRKSPGSTPMAWLMLAVGFWALASGFESAAPTQELKILWSKIGYFGTTPSPVLLLLFTLEFTHNKTWLSPRKAILLWIIPVFSIILAWTNEWHGLIWSSFSAGADPAKNILIYHHGLFFMVMIAYFYAILVINFLLMLKAVFRYKDIYARQSTTLLLGMAFPWIPNVLFIFHWEPIAGYDLTPVGFAITGLLLSWSILAQRLFDLVPIARELMIEWMKDAMIVLDDQNRIVDLNPAAVKWITALKKEQPGNNPRRWIGQPAEDIFIHIPDLIDTLNTKTKENIQISFNNQGQQVNYDGQISRFSRGKTSGRFIMLHEVTKLKQIQQKAVHARNLSDALLSSSTILNSTLNVKQIIDLILDQTAEVIDYNYASFQLIKNQSLEIVAAQGWEGAGESIGMQLTKAEGFNTPITQKHVAPLVIDQVQPGQLFMQSIVDDIQSCLIAPIVFQDEVIGYLCLYSAKSGFFNPDDVHFTAGFANQIAAALGNARLFEQVHTSAIRDSLTGLFNRRHLLFLAEQEINRSRRYQHPMSVIMIDVDHFKKVNDSYGHLIGDQVLRNLSRLISQSMREVDFIGRYGGEEFVIILPETALDQAMLAAQRLCNHIANTKLDTEKGEIYITVSLGVATYDEEKPGLDNFLEYADQALYEAKQNGRNQARAFLSSKEIRQR